MFPQFFPFVPKSQYTDMLECYKKTEAYYMKTTGGTLYPDVLPVLKLLNESLSYIYGSNRIIFIENNFVVSYHYRIFTVQIVS